MKLNKAVCARVIAHCFLFTASFLIGMDQPRDTASRATQMRRMDGNENRAIRITPITVVKSYGHTFEHWDRKRRRIIRPWDDMA
ncbi:hypothetical protein [Dyella sp.]|uniref:hypothetical protein n=1 Tax=Dyella sp. TaxID=1869338 RepID=UPI002D78801A|nr:hypothetical protein [Dyella sp.]HET7330127.1 hypothetical protein [Dyella sp.]